MHRSVRQFHEAELMDSPAADPAALGRALRFIRRINRALGYNAATLRALEEVAGIADCGTMNEESQPGTEGPASGIPHSSFRVPHSLSVLDVATGSADLPQEVGRWSRRRGVEIRCVGLDLHPTTLAIARRWAPEIPLVRGDALRLPFADASFDIATCSMFLHHLPTASAAAVLREMERVTRRGWIAADLLRRRRALAWISLFTLFAGTLERHDARLSVKQAWSPAEARALAASAGAPADYRETFGHRFLLVRRKPSPQ